MSSAGRGNKGCARYHFCRKDDLVLRNLVLVSVLRNLERAGVGSGSPTLQLGKPVDLMLRLRTTTRQQGSSNDEGLRRPDLVGSLEN